MKTKEEFDKLTFDKAYNILANACLAQDDFSMLVKDVAALL